MTRASPFHQLRGHVAREGAATALPAVRGVILPIDTYTGGAVTAAGGFLGFIVGRLSVHTPEVTHVVR